MDNESLRHDLNEVMALVKDQMREFSAAQQARTTLSGCGVAADGLVEVTVDAQRMVTSTVVAETYLQDFEFADLAGHITDAAQAAVRDVERRAVELFAPMARHRQALSAISGRVLDAPEFEREKAHIGGGSST